MLAAPLLEGHFIRLEPLSPAHADGLVAASVGGASLYRWSQVPRGADDVRRYIEMAEQLRDADKAAPFATVRVADGEVIGSTRFFDLESWAWPAEHERYGRKNPDVGEIGYTWLAAAAVRTAANTEAKLLMLSHAFETWGMLRVCLHTDMRNERSRAAIERIGGKFEGILRSHRMATDFIARDSARYSIIATEWPAIKQRLTKRLYST